MLGYTFKYILANATYPASRYSQIHLRIFVGKKSPKIFGYRYWI